MVARGHWQNKSNQRVFFDQLAVTLGIKDPSHWGSITRQVLLQHGGGSILTLHKGSFKYALKAIYPGTFF